MANGSNPNNRISITTFLASDNTTAFLANKTLVFVNDDNVNGINLLGNTLNVGANTVVEGFGNGATVVVPGGTQPANVIGTFHVRVLPFEATVAAATLIEHWLFCSVLAAPGVAGSHAVPLSFSRSIWLAARL